MKIAFLIVELEEKIMDKEVTIVGKFYLRNGNVIDEKIIFEKDDNKEDTEKTIKDIRDMIKKGFREDYNFQFTFGFTTFRGDELVAVKLEEAE
jgi:hypothetical protein